MAWGIYMRLPPGTYWSMHDGIMNGKKSWLLNQWASASPSTQHTFVVDLFHKIVCSGHLEHISVKISLSPKLLCFN